MLFDTLIGFRFKMIIIIINENLCNECFYFRCKEKSDIIGFHQNIYFRLIMATNSYEYDSGQSAANYVK